MNIPLPGMKLADIDPDDLVVDDVVYDKDKDLEGRISEMYYDDTGELKFIKLRFSAKKPDLYLAEVPNCVFIGPKK